MMGNIRKIGNDYFIEFYARGLLYQKKSGKDKQKAQQLLKDTEEKIKGGESNLVIPRISVDQFLTDVLNKIRLEHTSLTFYRYESVANHFKKFCLAISSKKLELSDVTPNIIEEYRLSLINDSEGAIKVRPRTVNFTLLLLKDILGYAINLGYLNDNPTLHIKLVDVVHGALPRVLTGEETAQFLNNLSVDLKDVAIFLLRTGARLDELLCLKWACVDFIGNCFRIEGSFSSSRKKQKGLDVPMDSDVRVICQRLRGQVTGQQGYVFCGEGGGRLDRNQLVEEFGHCARKQGINKASIFPIIRNTFARDMVKKGVSLVDLYRLMGYSDIARVVRHAGFVRRKMV